jgi:hypothetical protein
MNGFSNQGRLRIVYRLKIRFKYLQPRNCELKTTYLDDDDDNNNNNPQKLALTSPTSGGRLVGIVRLRTKAKEFSFVFGRSEVLATDPEVPGSIPGATRFSVK